ncbi:MAG: YtxH domain-containing protein [Bacteroidetes bacterium]|nr:MAG: YtxH domain-containing protein [Bacteroidota bacterium]
MNTGKALLGIIGGFAAGALIGVLFAPDKGIKTRKKIMKKGEAYVDEMKDKVDEMVEEMNSKFDDMMNEAKKLAIKGRAKANSLKDEVLDAL